MKSRPIATGQNILASQNNDRRDDARGGSFLLAHQQLGTLALGTNPSNNQVVPIVVNGTTITITFVSSIGSTPNNVLIGANAAASVANLIGFLRRPDVTSSTQIAAASANQTLLSYVGWAWPGSSTNIVPFSLNKNVNGITGPLSSFNITGITVTSGTWTAATMQLYVEDGTYFINGTRYLFTGGSTPSVTAPSTNPRIDVLSIDSTGTLAWTTGTEAASPSAPTYPVNKVPICELYNVVGETGLFDSENQQTSQGYILNDVRPFIGPVYIGSSSQMARGVVTNVQQGNDASKAVSPSAGDVYIATDTGILYICFTAGTWQSLGSNFESRTIFTGNGTFTAPSGVTSVYVTILGGGGGGGGITTASNQNAAGGGGGGGGYLFKYAYTVIPTHNYSVTVGTAGTGGANGTSNGTAGGNSVFDTLTVTGGSFGASQNGAGNGAGGTAGTPNGTAGAAGNTSSYGGGGGGASPSGVPGAAQSLPGNGNPATGLAAGGGGANISVATGSHSGGNGAPGIVIVEW